MHGSLYVNRILYNNNNYIIPGDVWLAAYEVGDTKTFTWINHDALLSYYRWDDDQPNGNQQHCIFVNRNLMMYDRPCSQNKQYICECPYVR